MNKIIKFVFAFIVFVCLPLYISPIFAQNGYTPIERKALDKALTVIEDYETLSSLSDEDSYYSFLELFVSEDVQVYNDLLGLAAGKELTVKSYADLQHANAKSTQVFISDIKRESLWEDGDNWKIQLAFDKTISYTNKCGVYFSTSDFYGSKHYMHAVLVYESQINSCKIEKITGSIDSDAVLPNDFYTLQRSGEKDKGLKYNRRNITYNSYGQAYLEAPVSKSQFSYSDADVVAVPKINDECKLVSVNYKARRWAVKLHYDLGLGETYSLEKNLYGESKSSANSFGLDFGYIFPSKSKLKTGLFLGVGMSQSKLDLSCSSSNDYSYTTNQDVTGLTYNRYYKDLSLSQSYKMSDLVIPVYFDFDWHFTKLVSLYIDLGAKVNYNLSHKVESTQGSAYIYGIYRDFDNLLMNELWGRNGFGNYTVTTSDDADIVDYNAFTVDAFGGAGLRIGIPNVPVYLDLGVSYQYGFMNLLKSEVQRSLSGTATYNTAIMYNTISGTKSTEHVRNLIEGSSYLKRNKLSFNIGLMLKF